MNKKKRTGFLILVMIAMISAMILGGCGKSAAEEKISDITVTNETINQTTQTEDTSADSQNSATGSADNAASQTELLVTFGDSGNPFSMHLYDNKTAAAIAGYVGTSQWRLPIYEYDDDVNYDIMEYYDIPSRYEIPSNPTQVTSEKAGEAYYSEPNRVILFYEDAEVSTEYTPIGYFDVTEKFREAVKENPVLEGWGNKIVIIQQP